MAATMDGGRRDGVLLGQKCSRLEGNGRMREAQDGGASDDLALFVAAGDIRSMLEFRDKDYDEDEDDEV